MEVRKFLKAPGERLLRAFNTFSIKCLNETIEQTGIHWGKEGASRVKGGNWEG